MWHEQIHLYKRLYIILCHRKISHDVLTRCKKERILQTRNLHNIEACQPTFTLGNSTRIGNLKASSRESNEAQLDYAARALLKLLVLITAD